MKKLFTKAACVFFSAAFLFSCNEDDTVSLSNLTPDVIAGDSAINALLSDVSGQNSSLEDCLSINYPITINGYNADLEFEQAYVIENDASFEAFLDGLDPADNYAIQYPVSVTGFNGQIITITSNVTLVTSLQAAVDECQANSCDTNATFFQQAYGALSTMPNVQEEFTMDAWTHEYTFSMAQSGTICSIGYKAEDQPTPIVYLIEILDSDGTVVYSGNHSFSTTEREYISIPAVSINANEQYTIKRSIESYDVGSGIGTILWSSQNTGAQPAILPYTQGDITIHQARYYGGGGSLDPDYHSLPMLDFVFKTM